jgi:hypothetical protein
MPKIKGLLREPFKDVKAIHNKIAKRKRARKMAKASRKRNRL